MFEESLEALPDGRKALERWQTPAEFIAKVEELAAPIKSDKLFNRAEASFLLDAMVLAEFVKFRPTEQVRLVGQSAQWPDGQTGSPKASVNIEITEVLEEGRRRGDEYREGKEAKKETAEDWRTRALAVPERLDKAIERKIAKGYAGKCKLVVYLNMSTYSILQKETEAAIAAVKAKYADNFDEICVLWQEKLL
ncbi:hypothetical protein IVA86_29065 [Bradyrhizobium sp. 146]|uniref:hypothetical protein n=1 Tax=Bradyrhizobium sp. 146 TaxID=2782622 RepID=UPI001FF73C22|nr:hypothetical protein [Bradyrhizobium sp. 146]MCK1705333.1 hypothetical protein [Bradyrhizobium sp. 146]